MVARPHSKEASWPTSECFDYGFIGGENLGTEFGGQDDVTGIGGTYPLVLLHDLLFTVADRKLGGVVPGLSV